jgi:hypothetical protein
MRYFTDGAGHVARVDTDSRLGDAEFSQADVETYNVKRREWVPAKGLIAEIRFGGGWRACNYDIARSITYRSQRRYDRRQRQRETTAAASR